MNTIEMKPVVSGMRSRCIRYLIGIGFLLVLGWLSGAALHLPQNRVSIALYDKALYTVAFLLLALTSWKATASRSSGPGQIVSGEQNTLILTAAACLTVFAAALTLSWRVLVPLHEDVAYITQQTFRLLQDGNLKNAGLSFPFQILRPDAHFNTPFYAHYVMAVFYFLPFFKVFGSTDVAFFIGQSVLLLMLVRPLARSGLGWRWACLILALSILSRTILESFCASPSQMLSLVLVAYFWYYYLKPSRPRPVIDGLLFAVSLFVRPEAVLIGILSLIRRFCSLTDDLDRRRVVLQTASAFTVATLLLSLLRQFLGANSASDNRMILLMSDVLAPGFDVLLVPSIPSVSDVLHDPHLRSQLIHKIIGGFTRALLPWSSWGRWDHLLVLLPAFSIRAGISRFRTYLPLYVFFLYQSFMNAALLPLPRHSDAVFFLFLWNLALDSKQWLEASSEAFHRTMLAGVLVVLAAACAIPLPGIRENIDQSIILRSERLNASKEAHALVPRDAFVITDRLELWLWYGRGERCCYAPAGDSETMRLLLERYPEAYVVFFQKQNRENGLNPTFHRPLRSASQFVSVYGPVLSNSSPVSALLPAQ